MNIKSIFLTLSLLISFTVSAQEKAMSGDLIRLVAPLDEPEFYCFDLLGWGDHLQLEDPLQTHTCKTQNSNDQEFHFVGQRLKVSHYDRCVQVAGSSNTTLVGSAVLARPCSDTNAQQDLILDDKGRMRVLNTDFCIGAGTTSRAASGPSHMWRTLTVLDCDATDSSLITWQLGLQ